jgi:hypothetical protein
MDDAAFAPGGPEVDLDRQDGTPVFVEGARGKMGSIVLTNDRIVFAHKSYGPTGNIVGDLVAAGLEARSTQKAGGPQEILRIADLRGGRVQRRRLLPDLYELTLADGSTCRLHRALRKKWDPTIRRLLSERHGRAVREDGDGWRVESA